MKNTLKICVLLVLTMFFSISEIQAQNKKVIAAVHQLLEIPFFVSYDSATQVIENVGRNVKESNFYNAAEKKQLAAAYTSSAKRFNQLLESMKIDLLNADKINLILKDPKTYSESYHFKLEKADNAYQKTFVQLKNKLDEEKQIDGFSIPLLILMLEGTFELFKFLQDIKKEVRKFTDELLETYLIEPHRILSWEEL